MVRDLSKDGPAYVAFVTGASRTADIERVLAIGVHGPLEMHILLLED
jgi:L-lactate dehydrogenase complex protein LldG